MNLDLPFKLISEEVWGCFLMSGVRMLNILLKAMMEDHIANPANGLGTMALTCSVPHCILLKRGTIYGWISFQFLNKHWSLFTLKGLIIHQFSHGYFSSKAFQICILTPKCSLYWTSLCEEYVRMITLQRSQWRGPGYRPCSLLKETKLRGSIMAEFINFLNYSTLEL